MPETRGQPRARERRRRRLPDREAAHTVSRTVFLEISTLGLGGVIGGLVTLPVLGFVVGPAFLKQGVKPHDLGPLERLPGGRVRGHDLHLRPRRGLRLAAHRVRPQQRPARQPAELHDPLEPLRPSRLPGRAQRRAEVRERASHYKDVTTGPGQPVRASAAPATTASTTPRATAPRARPPRALDRYSFSIVNGHLLVGAPFSVAYVVGTGAQAQIHETGYAFPGEPVSGLESWLYPLQPPH